MTGPSAASALQPGARCAKHAERAATGVCTRCGDYLCGVCGRRRGERLFCASCAERAGAEHGRRAVHAYVLGLGAMHGLFPLGPLAIAFGASELAAIREGTAPLGGEKLARAGLWLGACGTIVPACALLLWLLLR